MTASTCASPATSFVIRGQDADAWYGWWADTRVEEATNAWAFAADAPERLRLAAEIGHIVLTEAATIPLGQSCARIAYRSSITGILPGNRSYPWNVGPSA